MCSGICTWITSAPQAASWRAGVGPARTCVRSMTRKRASAAEAGTCGIATRASGGAAELAHHAAQDPLEERGVRRLAQQNQLAHLEAAREVATVAFEHRLAGAIAEEEARLERAHVEELRGLARLVGVLADRTDADPRAFLELARQREVLRRPLSRDEAAGRRLRIDARLDRPRRGGPRECGCGIRAVELVVPHL